MHSQAYIPVTHIVDGNEIASPDFDDTSEQGAGDRNNKLTWEGRILKTLGGVSVEDWSALETSIKHYQP